MVYVLHLFVHQFESLPPAERFSLIMDDMCRAVAAGLRLGLAGPFLLLIWRRVRRTKLRFLRTLATPRTPYRPARPRPARPSRLHPLPRHKAWLLRLVPDTGGFACQLTHCLNQPDTMALLAADPRLGRILRPLCHALYIRPNQVPHLYARPTPDPAPPPPATTPSAPPTESQAPPQAAPIAEPPAALSPQTTPRPPNIPPQVST